MTENDERGQSPATEPQTASVRPVLKVWLDVVCPFCLLAKVPMTEAIEGLDVEVEYMPFELRPYPTPTLLPEDPYLPAIWARSVYPSAERLGISIKLPTISPQPYTRLAFEGFQFAKEYGKGTEYIDAVMAAFFQGDRDIGRVDVLERIADAIGLPSGAYRSALDSGAYAEAHAAALEIAARHDVRVVPSFSIGDSWFDGTPSSGELREAIEATADLHRPRQVGLEHSCG